MAFESLSKGSVKRVSWICTKGHKWEAMVYSRVAGFGCPRCSGRIPTADKYLYKSNPELREEWDYSKNRIDFESVLASSSSKAFWKCPKGHTYHSSIGSRARGTGCPSCKNRIPTNENCLSTLFPGIALEFNIEKNGTKPEFVIAKSSKKYWWKCQLGHEWETSSNHRVNGTGCPYCSNKKVTATNNLSFLYPELKVEWDTEKNNPDTFEDTIAGSSKKYWWVCAANHSYPAVVYHRAAGSGCPYCSGRKPSKENNLLDNFPEIAKTWDYILNGDLLPNNVTSRSDKVIFWRCIKNHVWEASVDSRVRGRGCPGCANRVIYEDNKLITTHPHLALEFDVERNSPTTVHNITAGTNKKLWWRCKFGHSWLTTGSDRKMGSDCPDCNLTGTSKREIAVACELEEILGYKVSDFKVQVKDKGKPTQVDILFENIIVEYDGAYWHSNTIEKDVIKNMLFVKAGYIIIRIREKPLNKLSEFDIIINPKTPIKEIVVLLLEKVSTIIDIFSSDIISSYKNSDGLVGYEIYLEKIRGNISSRKK